MAAALDLRSVDMLAVNEPSALPASLGVQGLTDLRAAISLVRGGGATSVVLCGFADGRAQLRLARDLAVNGVVIEPLVRHGGGSFDVRVKRLAERDT